MTLDQFKTTLSAAIKPKTILGIKGDDKGLNILLSDKSKLTAKRQRIKDCTTQAELAAYVAEVLK